jgi:potassium efflux system protein
MLMFRMLGFSWSTVQWLAAGLTVGLGFGLQEIFANLVSGLIILIERPVRVGDFVTVNGVSGHVTQMQLRATTIKDLDSRELIVPNKKFITEDVMNWTLSDRTTRVIIRVGIAYGSDTKKAQQVLQQVARANPLVKNIPMPEVVFAAFGESTLDFELRVMIATREVYFRVVHELNMAIDEGFRASGIEIAFPQRDIHVRGLPEALSGLGTPQSGAEPAGDQQTDKEPEVAAESKAA